MFEVFLCIVACALLENCVLLLQPFWLKFFSAAALKKAALSKASLQKEWVEGVDNSTSQSPM